MVTDDLLALADWRRRIAALYEATRNEPDPFRAWTTWRETRDELFRTHAQTPLPVARRTRFPGLSYFDHDPAARVMGRVTEAPEKRYDIQTSDAETMTFTRFGTVSFDIGDRTHRLELYWLEGYGGGIFLPFRDATSGKESYGGGRYLLDTIKGADLGMNGDEMVLDFNFAYNPSCAYDPRWSCPLAPPENRLEVAVQAGELAPRRDEGARRPLPAPVTEPV